MLVGYAVAVCNLFMNLCLQIFSTISMFSVPPWCHKPPEPAASEFKGSKHYKESCVLYDIEFMSLLLIQHPTNMRVSCVAKDLSL